VFPRLTRALVNVAILAIMIAPLIAGSVWIYRASAAAFRYQREVRDAQAARAELARTFLATESDVRGFAASGDRYFAASYFARVHTFGALAATLRASFAPLGLALAGDRLIAGEREAYRRWNSAVAMPILDGRRAQTARLLRSVDPALAARILDDDRRTGRLLDDAAHRSELARRLFLSRILIASVALVTSVAAAVVLLLLRHAAAERRTLTQRVLYEEERRVSRMLQAALAPDRLPPIDGVTLRAAYVPAASERQVGGDWYEAVELRGGRILLIIGDVAGHGLEAAVVMNRARQAILSAAVTDPDPAHILRNANRALALHPPHMVTAFCCVFDPGARLLTYAAAGHPPPAIAPPAGAARFLEHGGLPLGIVKEIDVASAVCRLDAGSTLVLYTDGLVEEYRDILASERSLLAAAERCRAERDPAAAIFTTLLPQEHPRDDVAILTMHVGTICAGVPLESSTPHRREMIDDRRPA
jgi:serine phosphatase RsbU (regulator of sigma subunit)